MRDILKEIWATTRKNKLRTALTGFAVAWGIFMLIFLLGAGNGLINANKLSSERFLDNSMVVFPGYTSKAYNGLKEGRDISFNTKDMETTGRSFSRNIDNVGATLEQTGQTITYGNNYFSGSLAGVYPNEAQINKREMLHGRFINETDIRQRRKTVVISEDNARELMPRNTAALIGKYVKINNIAFMVTGIYKQDKSSMQAQTYMPFTTLRTIWNRGDDAGNIVFSFHGLNTEQENEDFETQYRARLNTNHMAAPDDEGSIWIWNRFTNNMQMNKGIGIIQTALWIIGLFTLLSGIVGVSNIMLITVKERTREFGIRKAIGAGPASILRLIIAESVIITTIFGSIGMLLGIASNLYMDATIGHTKVNSGLFEATMFYNPVVELHVCLEALAVIVIAGTVAGVIPARKAARIRPIEALRAE